MAVRPLLATLSASTLIACGGGGTAPGPTGPEPAQPILSFSAISGVWEGGGFESNGTRFWIEVSLASSARRGEGIGEVGYPLSEDTAPVCGGVWVALTAEDPVYTVEEKITFGECPDGSIRLVHDPVAGTLDYTFTPASGSGGPAATGALTRP